MDVNLDLLVYNRDYNYFLQLEPNQIKTLDRDLVINDAEDRYSALYKIDKNAKWNPAQNRDAETICSSSPATPTSNFQGHILDLCETRKVRNSNVNKNFGIRDTEILLREANLKFKIGDSLTFLIGYHTFTWGQLPFWSPIDSWLPTRVGSGNVGLTKADNRYPQVTALLSWFPNKNTELQLYFFPEAGFDPIVVKNALNTLPTIDTDYYKFSAFQKQKGNDIFRYAARFLFYFDKTTLGLTYYYGFNQFAANYNFELEKIEKDGQSVYKLTGDPTLSRIQVTGLEWSHKFESFTLNHDTSWAIFKVPFGGLDLNDFNSQTLGLIPKDSFYDKRQMYIDWIFQNRGGRLSGTEHLVWSGMSFSWDKGSRWHFDYGFVLFGLLRSSTDSDGFRKYLDAEPDAPGRPKNGVATFTPAPLINTVYYIDEQKNYLVGQAGGVLPGGGGYILYFSQRVLESFRFSESLELLYFNADSLVQESGYQIAKDKKSESIFGTRFFGFPTLRFVMYYQF